MRNHAQTPLKNLVLDEIFSFIGRKKSRVYMWTAWGETASGERLAWYHLDHSKGQDGLARFRQDLPAARNHFADGNPAYADIPRCHQQKSGMTNRVESLNAQVRQYVSFLRRKTKGYAKSPVNLSQRLALVFMTKCF